MCLHSIASLLPNVAFPLFFWHRNSSIAFVCFSSVMCCCCPFHEAPPETMAEAPPTDSNKSRPGGSMDGNGRLPLMSLNHVSRLCRSVEDSRAFYANILGFVSVDRPEALDFEGAWLFNYGVGIHLVRCDDQEKLHKDPDVLDPMDNHISFQCEDMEAVEEKLKDRGVKYLRRTVEDNESRTKIEQLFFNDPDGFMIEICNCETLKLRPAGSLGKIRLPNNRHSPPVELDGHVYEEIVVEGV